MKIFRNFFSSKYVLFCFRTFCIFWIKNYFGRGLGVDPPPFTDRSVTNRFLPNYGWYYELSRPVLCRGERDFSVNLIKALFKKFESKRIEKNIFISPSSIYHTLLLAYFGARGLTQKQLEVGLGLTDLAKPDVLKVDR